MEDTFLPAEINGTTGEEDNTTTTSPGNTTSLSPEHILSSSGPRMLLYFYTDAAASGPGFEISYWYGICVIISTYHFSILGWTMNVLMSAQEEAAVMRALGRVLALWAGLERRVTLLPVLTTALAMEPVSVTSASVMEAFLVSL